METEREELRMRQQGYLAKAIGNSLPAEDPEELERLIQGDASNA